MQNQGVGVGCVGSGTVAGAAINIAIGNAGLAFSGTAVSLGMTPFAGAGAVIGAASYGILEAVIHGDTTALSAASAGGLCGAAISVQLGGMGLAFNGTAVSLGVFPLTIAGSVVGLAVYGLLKLMDGTGGETAADLFQRMATQLEDRIAWQTFYTEALLELDPGFAEAQWLQKFAELEIQEELTTLKREIGQWQQLLQAQWKTTPELTGQMTSEDFLTWQCVQTLKTYSASINAIALNEKGHTLVTGCNDGTVNLWNLTTGQCTYTFYGHSQEVLAVAFSSQKNIIASAGCDHKISGWHSETQKLLYTAFYPTTSESHSGVIYSLTITPDQKTLISASADKTIRLWHLQSGTFIRTLSGHTEAVNTLAVSPDGQFLVSGSADKTLKIWQINSSQPTHTLIDHSGWITSVAISPSGEIIASGSTDKTIKLWNLHTGELIQTFRGHSHSILSVAFSPDSQILASASPDGIIHLWDIEIGEIIQTLPGLYPVLFSPDGQTLISGGKSKTLKLWQPLLERSNLKRKPEGSAQWWEVLGVTPTATPEEVKQAYRNLARQYHPDINSSPEAKSKMQAINHAYRESRLSKLSMDN